MSHAPHVICLISALLAGRFARCEEEPVPSSQFQQWIVELRSEHRKIRQRAEDGILQMGDQALFRFPQAIADASPSLKNELIRLQRTLLIRGGEQDLLGTGITAAPITLQAAAQALSAASHAKVELSREWEANGSLSPAIRWENVLFWNALDGLCRDHHLQWRWTGSRSVILEPAAADSLAGEQNRATAVFGSFRMQAERPRTLSTEEDSGKQVRRIDVMIDVEPSVQPWYVSVHDADFELVQGDEPDRLFTPDARRELDFSDQQVKFALNFIRSGQSEGRPPLLRGAVHVHCSARPQELRFTLADPRDRIEFAGQQEVRLISQDRTEKELRLQLQILFPSDVSRDSHRLGHFHRKAWLENEAGKRIGYQTLDLLEIKGPLHEVQYQFPIETLPPGDLTLVYALPAFQANVRVPFLLRWANE